MGVQTQNSVQHCSKLTTLNTHTSHSSIWKHLYLLFHSNPETITHFHKTSQWIFKLWQSEVNFSIMGQPNLTPGLSFPLECELTRKCNCLEMHNLTQCICTGTLQFCSWLWHVCQEELSIYTCSKSILYCTVGSLARITTLQVQQSSEFYLPSTNILPKLKCTLPFTQARHPICKYKSSRPEVCKKGIMKKPTVILDEELVACCSRFVGYFKLYQ